MKKFDDILFGFTLSSALFILWVTTMFLTADIPVVVSKSSIIGMSILFIALTITYIFYAVKSRQNLINLVFLAIPLKFSIINLSWLEYFPELAPMCLTNFICAVLPCLIFSVKLLINIKRGFTKKI